MKPNSFENYSETIFKQNAEFLFKFKTAGNVKHNYIGKPRLK